MAVRGYDRGQVDDYVARLGDFLADAEQRATRAEGKVADLMRQNERLTEELRQAIDRRAVARSGTPYEGLGERVADILRLAADEADVIRQEARTEADATLEEAMQRRDDVLGELRRVQDALATLGLGKHALNAETIEAAADAVEIDDEATHVIHLPTVAATS
jgi:cell division septum initiation protein DivIVA